MTQFTFVPSRPLPKERPARKIAMVVYSLAEVLDITGPYEVFSFASMIMQRSGVTDHPAYQIEIFADRPGPIRTLSGLEIIANRSYHDLVDDIDTLFIPGGDVTAESASGDCESVLTNLTLLDWIKAMAPKVRRLASVCSGAFLLAHCGLLDNRRATTHWDFSEALQKNYPAIKVDPDKIFIRDGNIYSSGGITSGIDLALSMLEEDWGREVALYIARYLVVFLKRPGGQSQFSTYLTCESSNRPDIRELQAWIIDNPAENHHVDLLAERMAMSPRNFSRTFLLETGMTPGKFVERVRIDAARHYLEQNNLSIETVADKAGFMDAEKMRRTFIRHLGVNPKHYRERFSSQNVF
ncbi:GlxA family transcriptional regulator [Methylomarinum vadi]|uniref:GlxA family transcriptional regulator n=1 Tax=Methylomarinum vadi TaxID=438855 RepID=UPI00055BFBE9|nr:GlxA family transcriptional regulator [Methylomarinum vadi]